MIEMCRRIYKLDLDNRPIDEVFAKIDTCRRYLASNYGLIFDTLNNRICSQFKYRDENNNKKKYYYRVNVVNDFGKKICARTNRLVLMAFKPMNDYSNLESNHIDLNTENNCLSNLEWTTHLENVRHYYNNVNNIDYNEIYSDENVHKICIGLSQGLPYAEIAKMYLNRDIDDTLYSYISRIRQRALRIDISSQYTFPNKVRNTAIFTDDKIHEICKYIKQDLSNEQILSNLGIYYKSGSKEKTSILRIINRIRTKSRFTRISHLYF